jgi:3-oxoacyl-[acyl-carrier protein] reductase
LHPHGTNVGTICPGGVKTEFVIGRGRTEARVEQSELAPFTCCRS